MEAEHPSLGSSENFVSACPHDHLAGGVERPDAGEDLLGTRGLVGDEVDPECARLAVDPFMEAAAHPAAAIVVNLNPVDLFR
jgi:hypothetical protein